MQNNFYLFFKINFPCSLIANLESTYSLTNTSKLTLIDTENVHQKGFPKYFCKTLQNTEHPSKLLLKMLPLNGVKPVPLIR